MVGFFGKKKEEKDEVQGPETLEEVYAILKKEGANASLSDKGMLILIEEVLRIKKKVDKLSR